MDNDSYILNNGLGEILHIQLYNDGYYLASVPYVCKKDGKIYIQGFWSEDEATIDKYEILNGKIRILHYIQYYRGIEIKNCECDVTVDWII